MANDIQRTELIQRLLDANLIKNSHASVYDYQFQKTLANAPWHEWLSKPNYFEVKEEYKIKFKEWLLNNKFNNINGLDRFTHSDLISGTTQSFDEAYYRYRNRRLRIFRGEYAYHKRIVSYSRWIDDEPICETDYLIISIPFCGNGYLAPNLEDVLNTCDKLKVPVIIDCAWYGTCYDMNIDLSHDCITEVSFSLTKSTGTGNIRSGIRYSNYDDGLPIRQQNNYNHLQLGSAQLGIWMMQHFSSDWVVSQYKESQLLLCNRLNVEASKCIHIANANGLENWHSKFIIDEKYYKLGIREALKTIKKKELII